MQRKACGAGTGIGLSTGSYKFVIKTASVIAEAVLLFDR